MKLVNRIVLHAACHVSARLFKVADSQSVVVRCIGLTDEASLVSEVSKRLETPVASLTAFDSRDNAADGKDCGFPWHWVLKLAGPDGDLQELRDHGFEVTEGHLVHCYVRVTLPKPADHPAPPPHPSTTPSTASTRSIKSSKKRSIKWGKAHPRAPSTRTRCRLA